MRAPPYLFSVHFAPLVSLPARALSAIPRVKEGPEVCVLGVIGFIVVQVEALFAWHRGASKQCKVK